MEFGIKEIVLTCVLLFLVYKYFSKKFEYWKKKGVKGLHPVPFLGDDYKSLFWLADGLQCANEFYDPFKGHRFGGIFIGHTPFLTVTDPDLLKQIMVKDSEYFMNRHDWTLGSDPLFSKNLVSLKDENWRKMRAVMTTVFTSAKMKDMFCFMDKCAISATQYVKDNIAEQLKSNHPDGKVLEKDMKEIFSRYGTDVIGSTAFGFEVDSFKNPNNEFYTSGLAVRDLFSGLNAFKFVIMMLLPTVSKALNLTFFGKQYTKYFIELISDTIKEREEKNIIRKDLIHILMEARKGKVVGEDGEYVKGKLPDLTDQDIAAQAVIFFFGGFETIATLLGFAAYELAINPDAQETLYQEVTEVIEKENGITYDGVMHQMKYLDMVVQETLRKWPPALGSDREVSKTYVIPKTDTSPELVLNSQDNIWIPISGLHYDPEYFPNPHKFDPERFRDEKNTIKPFTYLPFGEGIRHCIGMRYALMEAKTILVHLLRNFQFVPTQKTDIPIKLSKKKGFQVYPDKGFIMGMKLRT